MSFFNHSSSNKPTKAYILSALKTPLGEEKANKLWEELCIQNNVDPEEEDLDIMILENILIDLIKKGGILRACGKSILMKLVSYVSQL